MNKVLQIFILISILLAGCSASPSPKTAATTTKNTSSLDETEMSLLIGGMVATTIAATSVAAIDDRDSETFVFPIIMGGTGVVFFSSALIYSLSKDDDKETNSK